jgi:hypothetical protein
MKQEIMLTNRQIAERLCISPRQAARLMAEMHPVNIGLGAKNKLLRVHPDELERWIQAHTVQPEYGRLEIVKPPKRKHIDYTACGLTPEGKIPYRRAERRNL